MGIERPQWPADAVIVGAARWNGLRSTALHTHLH